MKRPALLLLLLFIYLSAHSKDNDGNINFISPGYYQLAYHQQIISIYFDECRIPSYHNFITPAELTESERYAVVKTIKEKLDPLPLDFIQKYLSISIYPFHIFRDADYGFYYNNEIVIDIDKIKPNMSFVESITSTLMKQISAITLQAYSQNESTMEMVLYLEKFNTEHPYNLNDINVFESGYVTMESTGKDNFMYSANRELRELFSCLLNPNSRNKLQQFIDLNPNSILAQKVGVFIDYLVIYSPAFSRDYFFDSITPPANSSMPQVTDINGEQLLNLHEIKSNETYDFTKTNYHEDLLASTSKIPTDVEMNNKNNTVYSRYENDKPKTLFEIKQSEQPKSKKTTRKKKKKGAGRTILWITGIIVLLSLLPD